MTRTTQALSRCTIEKTEKPKLTEAELTEAEENICDILSVCDSLNRLCETLGRLAHVLQRKNTEIFLQRSV
jgi:hypothetical protein